MTEARLLGRPTLAGEVGRNEEGPIMDLFPCSGAKDGRLLARPGIGGTPPRRVGIPVNEDGGDDPTPTPGPGVIARRFSGPGVILPEALLAARLGRRNPLPPFTGVTGDPKDDGWGIADEPILRSRSDGDAANALSEVATDCDWLKDVLGAVLDGGRNCWRDGVRCAAGVPRARTFIVDTDLLRPRGVGLYAGGETWFMLLFVAFSGWWWLFIWYWMCWA